LHRNSASRAEAEPPQLVHTVECRLLGRLVFCCFLLFASRKQRLSAGAGSLVRTERHGGSWFQRAEASIRASK